MHLQVELLTAQQWADVRMFGLGILLTATGAVLGWVIVRLIEVFRRNNR